MFHSRVGQTAVNACTPLFGAVQFNFRLLSTVSTLNVLIDPKSLNQMCSLYHQGPMPSSIFPKKLSIILFSQPSDAWFRRLHQGIGAGQIKSLLWRLPALTSYSQRDLTRYFRRAYHLQTMFMWASGLSIQFSCIFAIHSTCSSGERSEIFLSYRENHHSVNYQHSLCFEQYHSMTCAVFELWSHPDKSVCLICELWSLDWFFRTLGSI